MKLVILAAGRGTRMGALTDVLPKPMLVVNGKNLIEHKLDVMPSEVDEVILVVGYLKEKIISHFGDSYIKKDSNNSQKEIKITYVDMPELTGTGGALWLCKDLFTTPDEKFLVLMGDDIYGETDIQNSLKHDWVIGVIEVPDMRSGGKVVFDENHRITGIIEGNHAGEVGYANTGLYVLTPKIFSYNLVKKSSNPAETEYGLPQTILAAKDDRHISAVQIKTWIQVTSPEDIVRSEEILNNN